MFSFHIQKEKDCNPSSRINWGLLGLLAVFLVFFAGPLAMAGELQVTWSANSETDLAGYRVYYGTAHATYSHMSDVGNKTSYTISNLVENQTYFVVVTAYDQSGNESIPSTEASAKIVTIRAFAQKVSNGVMLGWSALPNADSYEIYQNTDPYFQLATPKAVTQDSIYLDTSFSKTPGYASYYLIRAMKSGAPVYLFNRLGAFNIGLSKGINLVSLPLVPNILTLKNVLDSQLTGGSNASVSDKVEYWNGSKFDNAWLVAGTNTSYDGRWMDESGTQESPIQLSPDQSFRILIRPGHKDTVVTVAGAVSKDSSRVIRLVRGQNYIGSCYPVVVELKNSDLLLDGVVKGGTSGNKSDQILQWVNRSNTYEVAWLVSGTGSIYDGTWFNGSGTGPTTIKFRPGVGYILNIRGINPSQTWTYPNPAPNL